MPDFGYRAKEGPQKIVEGIVSAPTEAAAIEKIHQLGYVPLTVRPISVSNQFSISFKSQKSRQQKNRHLILLSRQLASLIKAGVPVLRAIHILAEQEKENDFRMILQSLFTQVKEGKTLSQAMESFPSTFTPLFMTMVRAGEQGGGLQEFLYKMALYLKKQEQNRTSIHQALAYPLLLGSVGIATVFFIIVFVIPKLAKLFIIRQQSLPLLTKFMISIGTWIQQFWFFLALATGAVLLFLLKVVQKGNITGILDSFKLKLPVVGSFLFKVEFARFCRTLEMCFSNGMTFLDALNVSIPTLDNRILKDRLRSCSDRVKKGQSFGMSLQHFREFPSMVTQLVIVGEESANIAEVLSEIANVYEEDVEENIRLFTTLLEPAMILIIGAVIGLIVMAILLPIFEMNTMM